MAESITGKIENTWSQVTFRGRNNSFTDHPDNDLCSGYETSVTTIANSSPRINSLDTILCYARVRMSNNKKKQTNKQKAVVHTGLVPLLFPFNSWPLRRRLIRQFKNSLLLRFSKSHFVTFMPLIAFIEASSQITTSFLSLQRGHLSPEVQLARRSQLS